MEILKNLCMSNAVSGHENEINKYITHLFSKFSNDVSTDKMGNVIAKLNNNCDFTILIEAHADEIGLIVKNIDENGYIEFLSVGGVDPTVIIGKEVTVHGNNDIFGVIGAKPPHLMNDEEGKAKLTFDKMFIDCGFNKETIEKYVKIGDVISFKAEFLPLQNNCFATKSVDNRIGIYMLYKLLERLSKEKLNANIVFLSAVQEELGCLGAKTAVHGFEPNYAIVIDVTHGNSTYIEKYNGFDLGKGATIGVGPNFSNDINNKLVEFSKDKKCQLEVCGGNAGTDAWPIQIAKNGIPCSLISVPIKHMHTQVELFNYDDVISATDIIAQFITEEGYVC